jgi:hypothetical protein
MSGNNRLILTTLTALAALGAVTAAQAQYIVQYSDPQGGYGYRAEPLYPYVTQPQVIYPQQAPARAYPYVRSQSNGPKARAVSKTDPDLVGELRKRANKKKIDKTIVVREKPVVREHVRIVDDPPIIVRREINEDQVGSVPSHAQDVPSAGRVIRAEAEVTIIGPDRMSIRLFRKRDGSDANAKVSKSDTKAEARADSKKTKIR